MLFGRATTGPLSVRLGSPPPRVGGLSVSHCHHMCPWSLGGWVLEGYRPISSWWSTGLTVGRTQAESILKPGKAPLQGSNGMAPRFSRSPVLRNISPCVNARNEESTSACAVHLTTARGGGCSRCALNASCLPPAREPAADRTGELPVVSARAGNYLGSLGFGPASIGCTLVE